MTLDPGLLERVDRIRMELDAMTPEECRACAELARDVKPRLETAFQRQVAEQVAVRFERRAADQRSA